MCPRIQFSGDIRRWLPAFYSTGHILLQNKGLSEEEIVMAVVF